MIMFLRYVLLERWNPTKQTRSWPWQRRVKNRKNASAMFFDGKVWKTVLAVDAIRNAPLIDR